MIPHAFDIVERLRAARTAAGGMLLGLDFDGTLAPIVPRPEDAALPERTRRALLAVAEQAGTSIAFISGRALADVRRRADISAAYYAGNHGLEIEGPDVHRVHPAAEAARALIGDVAHALAAALVEVPLATVEDKGLTLSVHYRRVREDDAAQRVRAITHDVCAPHPALRLTHGKKVVEIRPDVDWHKGRALRFLRETLAAAHGPAPTLFIGDDRTDEDAFAEVGHDGCAIVVADPLPHQTAAHAFLRSTDEVAALLERLALH